MTRESTTTSGSRGVWSDDEHERFREALHIYPNGPWKAVAAFVGTRTVRQVQTHAQKYHEKAARRLRDLRLNRARLEAPNVLIDFEMQGICEDLQRHRVPLSPRLTAMQPEVFDQSSGEAWGFGMATLVTDDMGVDSWHAPSYDDCIDFLVSSFDANEPLEIGLLDTSSAIATAVAARVTPRDGSNSV